MNDALERCLHQQLRRHEDRLDADTGKALAAARAQALGTTTRRHALRRYLMPTAGLVAAAAALVLLISPPTRETRISEQNLSLNSLQLYEDLDFYYWLADTQTGTTD